MIKITGSGIVYRNPRAHLESVHAWHPSLVQTADGELIATFDLAQAGESLDYHTRLSRSSDGGQTWSPPQRLFQDPVERRSTHSVRVAKVGDGSLVGLGGRFYRDDPNEGLVNRANLGYVQMDLFLLRSQDAGRTWEGPQPLISPLVGPAFEMCHRIVELADGRWLASTSTWKGWNGESPHGMQAVALVSHDKGRTWPEYLSVINQVDRGVISWEQGLAQLPDGRIVAVVWSFEEATGKSLPNRYAISRDGRTFTAPRENGMRGETAKLHALPDGRLLCMYRRLDRPGLWANLVRIDGDDWITVSETPVWQGMASGMSGARSSGDELGALKFGYPSMVQLPDGSIFAVFWCVEECLHIVRWVRMEIA